MEKATRFVILVVLYKLRPSDSETLRSLSRCTSLTADDRVIVRDNSPEALEADGMRMLKKLLWHVPYTYEHNGRNEALSVIYNQTIRTLKPGEFLVLFDHDSEFTDSYFTEAENAIRTYPQIRLFLPLIYCGKHLVSPSYLRMFKGSFWKKERVGLIATRNQTAINSGMVISADYLLNEYEGYDERLKFYGTDSYFMLRYGQTQPFFCTFPCRMSHTLNFYDPSESFETKARRFREARRALILCMSLRSRWVKWMAAVYMDVYSVKYAILQRDARFLFMR